jgi:hypothetical protein
MPLRHSTYTGRNNFFLAIQPSDPIEQHFSFSPYWIWSFIILILTGLAPDPIIFLEKKTNTKRWLELTRKNFQGWKPILKFLFYLKQ